MNDMKKKKVSRFLDFDLVPDSSGIILDSIWLKKDKSEVIIISAFGGQWHFKPLTDNEVSI